MLLLLQVSTNCRPVDREDCQSFIAFADGLSGLVVSEETRFALRFMQLTAAGKIPLYKTNIETCSKTM